MILELLDGIFGRRSRFQVNATQAIAVHPGEAAQMLHRDRWVWRALPLPPDFECVVNCIWAVDNFSASAGATRIVPRSLDLPDPQDTRGNEDGELVLPDGTTVSSHGAVPAEMSDGAVVIYSGATYHGAGANDSGLPRLGMALAYASVALRQEENQYLVVPPGGRPGTPRDAAEARRVRARALHARVRAGHAVADDAAALIRGAGDDDPTTPRSPPSGVTQLLRFSSIWPAVPAACQFGPVR